MASRGNPLRLMSVLTCFDALASGEHEVTYRVICDMDDPLTWKALGAVKLPISVHIEQGPIAMRMNEACAQSDADVFTGAADDTFPLAQHWDQLITYGLSHGHHAFSWQEANDPNNQTMIVLSKKWISAVGRMLPPYFPFWFGDTWIAEVYEILYEKPMPIAQNLPWGGKRGKTRGMRELRFWMDFFAATRVERMGEARCLALALDIPFGDKQSVLDNLHNRDLMQRERIPKYEEWFGADQGDPSEQYLSMKATAEQWLAEHTGEPCLIVTN